MRRLWPLFLVSSYVVVAACVGDDPGLTPGAGTDGGTADGAPVDPDGSVSQGDSSIPGDDAAADAGPPPCGYPGEDCCAAPALACRAGTTCGTGNKKCMVNELATVGHYAEIQGQTFTRHIASMFYDGKDWTKGPDVMTEAALSGYSATDLVSGGPGNFHITLFKSGEGKMFNFYSGLWRKCEPGQACVGPTLPPPAFWSVARISNDTWIGATNAIYRCAPGASCVKEVTGLENTTWGTGKLVGTNTQDIWFSALSRAFHFDGTKWTIHEGLKARTIFEVRKDDVWVADKTFQHWDGKAWSAEFAVDGAPLPGIVTSMSGSGSKDVWAVGYNTTDGTHPAFAVHWDGVTWSMKPLPAGAAESPSVYAPSPLEAFVACETGVYRWDGAQWTKMTMPTVDAGAGGQPTWDLIAGPATPRP